MESNEHMFFSYGEEEMRDVVTALYPRMIAYIRKMLGSRELSSTAEDIFQDVICQFMEKRPYVSRDKVSAYISRMVRNTTLNLLSRNQIEKHSIRVNFQHVSALDLLVDCESNEEFAPLNVDSVAVQDIINFSDSFSPRMQEIFYLSRVKGLTHREIAEHIGISTRMVERYLAQSVTLYRQHFDWHNDNEITS